GALGSAAVPAVFHSTATVGAAVPRCGRGVVGALYADGNHPAAAARAGWDTPPGFWRTAFAGGSRGAAGGPGWGRGAAISLGASGDSYVRRRLHPRRSRWFHLTVTASVAASKPCWYSDRE